MRISSSMFIVLLSLAASWLAPCRALAGETDEEGVVRLPPLLVEDVKRGIPWVYAEDERHQILGRCDESTARTFLRSLQQAQYVLNALLPPEFQGQSDLPNIYVLYSQRMQPLLPQQLMDDAYRRAKDGKEPRAVMIPNLRLTDRDNAIAFVYIDEDRPNDSLFYTSSAVRLLLLRRTPQLPDWFVDGFSRAYANMKLYADTYIFERAEWCSKEQTERIQKDPEFPRALLSMDELFSPASYPTEASQEWEKRTWLDQTALFVRWGLGESPERVSAFWTFVDRASTEPVTERLFQECFGFGYADARDRLSDYLARAVKQPIVRRTKDWTAPKTARPRDATEAERISLKGEWDRQVLLYVRRNVPRAEKRYLDQARKTLDTVAYQKNPDLRAKNSLALLELECGNDAQARKLFEELISAKEARPRAYFELARLRFRHARAFPSGADGRLSREQVKDILDPLNALRSRKPALLESYVLYAAAIHFGEDPLSPAQTAVVREGLSRFPKSGSLALLAATLFLENGDSAGSAAVVERALLMCSEPRRRVALENFKKGIAPKKLGGLELEEPPAGESEAR